MNKNRVIVIDATNIGLGGGNTHLKEILQSISQTPPTKPVYVFASANNLNQLPDYNFLHKESHPFLNKSIIHRVFFQFFLYRKLIPASSIVFSITGDFSGFYKPMIGMSRNMLLYEREHWKKMEFKERIRFYLNYHKQKICFKHASGIIFISNYSKEIINKKLTFLRSKPQIVINHGVSKRFHFEVKPQKPIVDYSIEHPFVFNYISTVHTYKNHLEVIKAFYNLREREIPVFINFIGAVINKRAGSQFHEALHRYDPKSIFTRYYNNIPFEEIHNFYKNCDALLYASSCETMPNIVIEAMMSGRPLVCSNKESITEFTHGHAFYFNPESFKSIQESIINFLKNPEQREKKAIAAQRASMKYNWTDAANKTLEFINHIYIKHYHAVQTEKKQKPTVLILVRFYIPGYKYGGILRSIVNMVEKMGDEIDFKIITSDHDFGDIKSYSSIELNKWNIVGKAKVFYASKEKLSILGFAKIINETPHDLLFLNSFWDPIFTFKPLLARWSRLIEGKPTLLAPHGEFSESALTLKKWKKKPFIFLTKVFGFYNDIYWQSSNDTEAEAIKKAMGQIANKIWIVPDFPPLVNESKTIVSKQIRNRGDVFNICFLSRIAPTKNLDFALKVIKNIKIPIKFDIYGPIEDMVYWRNCQFLMKEIKSPVDVKYCGSIEYDKVVEIFGKYDLFFFPTKGENFGHVIIESMLAGTPVLISDTTPWQNLQENKVGWDIALSHPPDFELKIYEAASIEGIAYQEWRERVKAFATEACKNGKILQLNRDMIHKTINKN